VVEQQQPGHVLQGGSELGDDLGPSSFADVGDRLDHEVPIVDCREPLAYNSSGFTY